MRSYREAISESFREFFPETEVFEAQPENLEREVRRLQPEVVICSKTTDIVEALVPNWIELYPDDGLESTASIGGERTTFASIQLSELFSIFGQAEATTSQSVDSADTSIELPKDRQFLQ